MKLWPVLNVSLEEPLLFCNGRVHCSVAGIICLGIVVIITPLGLGRSQHKEIIIVAFDTYEMIGKFQAARVSRCVFKIDHD